MFRLISLLIGYVFGMFQTSYIIGKYFFKLDIREFGSKNAGATNTLRVLGKKIAFVVFALDIIKAVLAYIICSVLFKGDGTFYIGGGEYGVLPGVYAGLGAIVGHNFPFFLKFKGGKGSSCGLGLLLALDFKVAILSYVTGIIIILISRFISLASMIIALSAVIWLVIFKFNLETVILTTIILLLSLFQHRENIIRIFKGTERKFSFKSSGGVAK